MAPSVVVEVGVLLEVRHAWGVARVAAGADKLERPGGGFVGVDLIPQHQQGVGPVFPGVPQHLVGQGEEGVALVAFPAEAAAPHGAALQGVGRLVRDGDPAGAVGQDELPVRARGLYGGRREGGVRLRPRPLPVQADRVLVDGGGLQVGQTDQGVVVTLDGEGRGGVGEAVRGYLNGAGRVRLDPDRGVRLAGVAQEGAED